MVEKIAEDKDASADEKKVKEFNTGTFCFDNKSLLSVLEKITADNKQGEYYLTDALELLREENLPVWAVVAANPQMEQILSAPSSGQTTVLP